MTGGVVVWVTGLPSSGKSRFARELTGELRRSGVAVCTLDGDEVRRALGSATGYSADERAVFYEALGKLAALLAGQGLTVVVPATAHRRSFRERARTLFPAFIEVWVDTPLEDCARRDSKGLYAAQAAGRVKDVPGADAEYEVPLAPDVTAHGGADGSARAAVVDLVRRLRNAAAHSG